jgi:hypothetical protein
MHRSAPLAQSIWSNTASPKRGSNSGPLPPLLSEFNGVMDGLARTGK